MKIGLYGDSTRVGAMVYGGVISYAEITPAKMLQMLLNKKYGVGVHTVHNYGVGGSTIADSLAVIAPHFAANPVDIAVPNFGINCAYVPGQTPANHKANYTAYRNFFLSKGAQFVYESPNPIISPTHNPILTSLDAAVKTIAGLVVADTRSTIVNYYPQWASHLSDGTHPNQIMYLYIGQLLFGAIDPLL